MSVMSQVNAEIADGPIKGRDRGLYIGLALASPEAADMVCRRLRRQNYNANVIQHVFIVIPILTLYSSLPNAPFSVSRTLLKQIEESIVIRRGTSGYSDVLTALYKQCNHKVRPA